MSTHGPTAFVGLWVKTDEGSQALCVPLAGSERLPTVQEHQEGQNDFRRRPAGPGAAGHPDADGYAAADGPQWQPPPPAKPPPAPGLPV